MQNKETKKPENEWFCITENTLAIFTEFDIGLDTCKEYEAFKCHIWICVNFCRQFARFLFFSLVGWLDRLA